MSSFKNLNTAIKIKAFKVERIRTENREKIRVKAEKKLLIR